jgi:hypothetical protein
METFDWSQLAAITSKIKSKFDDAHASRRRSPYVTAVYKYTCAKATGAIGMRVPGPKT